jgi:hypothetical protein
MNLRSGRPIGMNITPSRPDATEPARIWFEDGSSASAVIDLVNGPTEDPEDPISLTPLAPGLSVVRSRWQPIRVGHVAGNVLDADRICTDGKVIPPQEASFIDAECSDCDSELAVLPHQEPGVLWFVIEHSVTCPALAVWTGSQP